MLIPKFWAVSRLQIKLPSRIPFRQITIRRWGWSDFSQDEAQTLADQRAAEAMQRILAGESMPRREKLDVYGTEHGIPIREEIAAQYGPTVITRNSYGALCLNTPNVWFADIDSSWKGDARLSRTAFQGLLLVFLIGIVAGFVLKSTLWFALISLLLPMLVLSYIIPHINENLRQKFEAVAKINNLAKIRQFVARHASWHLRVYETPAGYRLLAMHATFDPNGQEAKGALAELESDVRFVRLCALQSCFRARVSPKYWRLDYSPTHSFPKCKYPFTPEQLQLRHAWIKEYEDVAENFAACRFIERLGTTSVHPEAEAVRRIHDNLCRAETNLPLA